MIQGHKVRLADERMRAAEAEVQAKALDALQETVASSKDDRTKLSTYVLKDEEIIDLLSLIERTALEQGVVLKTNSLTVVPIDDTFEELQVTVEIQGSFDGVLRMVRILEHIPEQSAVPRVMLTKSGTETASWQANVDVRVTKLKKV
jgi:Tfp pilus assembly protein PilO